MNDVDDVTPGEMRRWLARVDRRVEGLDDKVARLDGDLRDRLDRIDKVSRKEWEGARETDQRYAEETRAIASAARAASVGILVAFGGVVLAGVIGIVVAVVG